MKHPSHVRRSARRAFSLLEVLLAIAIFASSMAILAGFIDTGVQAAIQARDLSRAQMLCEARLEEVLMQTSVPVSLPETALDTGDPTVVWCYSVEVTPSAASSINQIRVTVRAAPPGTSWGKEAKFSLVRWMPDPTLGLDQIPVIEAVITEGGEENGR